MQGEEARKSLAGDDRPTEHHVNNRRAHKRYAAGHGRPNPEAPVGVLIETQHLAGERHAECAEQQYDTRNPGQLAWVFECTEKKDLDEVQKHDRNHEIRTPVVQGTQKPTELLLIIQIFKAGVSLTR